MKQAYNFLAKEKNSSFWEKRLNFLVDDEKANENENPVLSEKRLNQVEEAFLAKTGLDLKSTPLDLLNLESETRAQIEKALGGDLKSVLEASQDGVLREAIKEKLKVQKASENWKDKIKVGGRLILNRRFSRVEDELRKAKEREGSVEDQKEYSRITNAQEATIQKLLIYSPKFLRDKLGDDLGKLDGGIKTNLTELLDYQAFLDGWEGDPASRILLANLFSPQNQTYLGEVVSERGNEIQSAETEANTIKVERDSEYSKFVSAREAKDSAKKEEEKAEARLEAKKKLTELIKTRERLETKKTRIEKQIKGGGSLKGAEALLQDTSEALKEKVDPKSRASLQDAYQKAEANWSKLTESLEEQNAQLADNDEAILEQGNLFAHKRGKFQPNQVEFIIREFEKNVLINGDLNQELQKARDNFVDKEEAFKLAETSYNHINQKYEAKRGSISELKINERDGALGKSKMSVEDVLIAIKTRAFEASLKGDGVPQDKLREKAKALATSAVGSEISKVKNNTHAETLTKQAQEAMEKRGFKNTLVGKSLAMVKRGFDFVDKDKTGNRRSVGVAKKTGGIARGIAMGSLSLLVGSQMGKAYEEMKG